MAHKHVIRAKTRNLFDYKNPNSTTKTITSNGITLSLKNDYFELYGSRLDENKYFECSLTGFNIPFKAGETYVLSLDNAIPQLQIVYFNGFYNNDTTKQLNLLRVQGANNKPLQTFTPIKDGYFSQIVVYSSREYTFSGNYYMRVQIELGSTPTPYTPYNYLQSNKRMVKVSNICQLLPISDKEDGVKNGVTFTNNDDGSWTLSGISTSSYSYYHIFNNYPLRQGHIYLNASVTPFPNVYVEVKFFDKDGVVHWAENPYTADEKSKCVVGFIKLKGNADTVVLTPQLIDLTEMYGAGNEPKTVAEFRQRFSDEYYPYSPQCWLASYESAVVCKTRNLFDINNAVPYTFHNENPPSNRISLKDGIYTSTYNNYNVGTGLRIKNGLVLSPGTYTLSLNVITVGETNPITGLTYGFQLYKSDGTKPVLVTYTERRSRVSHAFTIPTDCTDIRLYLAPFCNNGQDYVYISLKDIQLEQGSTATTYTPYQHL